jgi:hypothetical protein
LNLISAIDDYLLRKESRPRESHNAYDIAACRRQLYYKWVGEKVSDPVEAGAIWKMRMGDAIHNLIHEFLESAGFDIIPEVSQKVKLDGLNYPISFRVDNLFIDKDGTLAGIEVKSSYGAGIKAMQAKGSPKPEHVLQCALYMIFAKIKRFYLLYIGRDNGYRTQFIIDEDTINGAEELIRTKLAGLEAAIESKKIPERDYLAAIKAGVIRDDFQQDKEKYKSDWQCCYCNFRSTCWEDVIKQTQDGSSNAVMF